MHHLLVSLCVALSLSACANPQTPPAMTEKPTPSTRHFRCGITPVTLTANDDLAQLSVDGNRFTLQRRPVASGSLWGTGGGDTGITFWDQGEQAVLKVAMRNYPPCDRVEAPR